MSLRSAAFATALACPLAAAPLSAARAQPIEGLYVGAGAGYSYLTRLQVNSQTPTQPPLSGGRLDGNGGFVGSFSLGYALGHGFRVELQGDYRQASQTLSRVDFHGGTSDTLSYGGYLNGLFDFDIGSPVIYPYIGGGVGYRETSLDHFRATLPASGLGYTSDGQTKGGFSAQGIIGAAIAVYGVPGLSVTTEFRYTGVFSDEKFAASENLGGAPAPATIKVGNQNNYAVLIGARYAFNAPPPPLPPAAGPVQPAAQPVPPPARTYLVFFDWDRADLTERARQIIAEAAANVAKVPVTRIEVNGYTDLSGTAAHNLRLSQRRAAAVQAELIRNGVAAAIIHTQGFGEANPLVPTAQGVREAQNRRVEIILK